MRLLVLVFLVLVVPTVHANPYLKEVACQKAVWASKYGFDSFDKAQASIPLLVAKSIFTEGPEGIKELIPKAVLENPKKNGPAHYTEWASSIFISPEDLSSIVEEFDPSLFYFVSSEGNLLKGRLPNPVSREIGSVENSISFTDPKTKKTHHWHTVHEVRREGNSTVISIHEVLGILEPFKDKYQKIKIEVPQENKEMRELVHAELASEFWLLLDAHEDGSAGRKAVEFALTACEKIEKKSELLTLRLDEGKKALSK